MPTAIPDESGNSLAKICAICAVETEAKKAMNKKETNFFTMLLY